MGRVSITNYKSTGLGQKSGPQRLGQKKWQKNQQQTLPWRPSTTLWRRDLLWEADAMGRVSTTNYKSTSRKRLGQKSDKRTSSKSYLDGRRPRCEDVICTAGLTNDQCDEPSGLYLRLQFRTTTTLLKDLGRVSLRNWKRTILHFWIFERSNISKQLRPDCFSPGNEIINLCWF